MKTIKLFFQLAVFLLISNNSFAQLYAKNADIYVADNYLFVNGDVNLDTSGNIFLRNESQLLQGTATLATSNNNAGGGKLSVFQEGTANQFHYNFWCSPVGATGAAPNGTFSINSATGQLNRPTGLTTSSPVTVLAAAVSSSGFSSTTTLEVAERWIWKYENSNIYALNTGGWSQILSGTVPAGLGFTMKGVSGSDNTTILGVQNNPGSNQRYDFRGKPNDGDITINLAANSNTLIGNPYPSAINLSAFLNNATNSTGVGYFYIQNTGPSTDSHLVTAYEAGYQAYTPGAAGTIGTIAASTFSMYDDAGLPAGASAYAGATYQRYFTPIGQGFMIRGNGVGGNVTMKNAYRVFKKESAGNFSEFSKNVNTTQVLPNFLPETPNVAEFDYTTVSTVPSPQIRFSTEIDAALVNEMVLTFDQDATDGVDHAKDAFTPNEFNSKDVAFKIDNNPYIISSIQFDENKVLPLLFRNAGSETNYKIKVKEILNFTGAQNVFVHDKVTGEYFDVLNGIASITLPAGNNGTRYEITFKNGTLATNQNSIQEFTVVQNNKEQQLSISNPSMLDLKEVNLYDVSGKLVFSKSKLTKNVNYQFSTSGLSEGVYIVNMFLGDNTKKAQKISIFSVK